MTLLKRQAARLEQRLNGLWFGTKAPTGLEAIVLRSLEWIFTSLRKKTRQSEKSRKSLQAVTPPLLVIGNLIAGGAGKTPIVIAVCKHLSSLGIPVGIVTRGYGRESSKLVLMQPGDRPDLSQTGDEAALLHAQTACPIAIGTDRQAAVDLLRKQNPNLKLIVSDDGLQHHRMARSHEWIVFDQRGAGNGRLLPAGPLREPLERLNQANFIVCTQGTCESLAHKLKCAAGPNWVQATVKIQRFVHLKTRKTLTPDAVKLEFAGQKALAMTGLGNPDKFFDALRQVLETPVHTLALPDHFDYPSDFCSGLSADILLVTAKDAVKLDTSDKRIWVAEAEVQLPRALTQALEEYVGHSTD